MRISGAQNVAADLQDIVSNREIFESNDDEAKLIYLDADPNANPIYEAIVFRSRFEYKVNETMVTKLNELNDPRLPVYAQENSDGEYRGKPSGINAVPSDEWNYDNVSAVGEFYIDPNLPGFFMSYSELQFLMAEARQKGLISTGTAAAYYYAGIEASFEFNGLADEYASYITENAVILSGTEASALKQIAEQNWLGLYCQGIESWTEWRRTGYPVLPLPIEALTTKIPSRFNYPPIEQSVNSVNYAAAVAAQGADLLTTDIWWMK